MRERLVITEHHADAAAVMRGAGLQGGLDAAVAGAEDREPSAGIDDFVDHLWYEVQALLPGEARDHAEDRAIIAVKAETLDKGCPVSRALLQ